MCVMVVDNAGIVEAKAVHDARNVAATDDAGIVADLEKFYVASAMVMEKYGLAAGALIGKNVKSVVERVMRLAPNAPQPA